jgi:hypothetical protein
MALPTPKAMQISDETQPLRQKYRQGGREYKMQKCSARTNQSNPVHKGDRWKTVRAAARRGTGLMPSHLK